MSIWHGSGISTAKACYQWDYPVQFDCKIGVNWIVKVKHAISINGLKYSAICLCRKRVERQITVYCLKPG